MKKVLAFLLTISLLVCLISGCAQKTVEAEPAATEEAVSAAPQENSTPAEEAEQPQQEPAEEPEPEPQEEAVPEPEYSFPLDETVTLTAWAMWIPGLTNYLDSANDNLVFQEMYNRTNVKIDMRLCASDSTAETEFNLLIASGDYPNLINNFKQYYTNGFDAAIEEEIILPLNDLLEVYMPNLSKLLENDSIYDDMLTTEGYIAQAAQITDPEQGAYDITEGLNIRRDWLDALGMDTPETFDDIHDYLVAAKNAYSPDETYYLSSSGVDDTMLAASGVSSGFYIDESGELKYGMQQEELRDYFKMINQWFQEGLFTENYIVKHTGRPLESDMASGYSALWSGSDESMNTINIIGANTGAVVEAQPAPVKNSGDRIRAASSTQSLVGNQGYSITTSCTTPEIAAMWLDYMYTEEGALLNNWGIEGETFEYDQDGLPYYTDLIANNPDGIPVIFCRFMYVTVTGTFLKDPYVQYYNYGAEAKAAVSVWHSVYDYYESDYPTAEDLNAIMTVEERSQYAALVTDLETYIDECVAQFVVGGMGLDDASWAEFLDGMNAFNLNELFELVQAKYDEYMELYA